MGMSVKTAPQVKVTCKRTSKKLNIEALDKNTINEIKKVTDIYTLYIEHVADKLTFKTLMLCRVL